MDKELLNNTSLMHDIINHAPVPRPMSVLLAIAFWGFHIIGTATHTELNLTLATFVSVFALIRYAVDFINWLKNRKK